MKRYMILSLILISSLVCAVLNANAAETKIGYINAIKIFDTTKSGKKAKALLEDYIKARQKIVDQEEDEIKKLEEEITKQGAVLSGEAKKEKEMTFQKKLAAYQKKAVDLNREIQEKKTEVLKEFNKTLEEVVKKLAEKEGYQIVFDKNPDIGTVVYITDSMDLSPKIVEEMDKLK
jgi:outer membrane protein